LGEASGGVIDVDLDCDAALALASIYLPDTGLVHGRPSKPDSHRFYQVESALKYKKFIDPDSSGHECSTIVETRTGPGHQTRGPPSTTLVGERLSGSGGAEPSFVDGEEWERAVARLAPCALIPRPWPKQGTRQDTALALAGLLLRGGMPEDKAATF